MFWFIQAHTHTKMVLKLIKISKRQSKSVRRLCRPYEGSHHVICYRFYTSIDLMKELQRNKMNLYVTGTMMSNRIPQELRITKCYREFKEMERTNHTMHECQYKTDHGHDSEMGLVICSY
jgi:hypothetical protein